MEPAVSKGVQLSFELIFGNIEFSLILVFFWWEGGQRCGGSKCVVCSSEILLHSQGNRTDIPLHACFLDIWNIHMYLCHILKTNMKQIQGCCKRMCRSVHLILCFSMNEEYKKN